MRSWLRCLRPAIREDLRSAVARAVGPDAELAQIAPSPAANAPVDQPRAGVTIAEGDLHRARHPDDGHGARLVDPCAIASRGVRAPHATAGLAGAVDLAAGGNVSCARTLEDGTYCWGGDSYADTPPPLAFGPTPASVSGLEMATQMSANFSSVCGRLADGFVRCQGANSDAFDDTGAPWSASAIPVDGLAGVLEVGVGWGHACALLEDASVWCWGENRYGELGDGTTEGHQVPARVVGLDDVVHLAIGYWHSCALLATREVRCWGRNGGGELGDGSRDSRPRPVTVLWSAAP